ncbi:MAG: GNAT family N-acetyltransferase [Pseudomonadota bacterium]
MIRKAGDADVGLVKAIAEAAYAPYAATLGKPPAPMVADFGAAQAAGDLFVLEQAGQVVAYIHLYRKEAVLHIENLAVHPSARRQGLAGRLLDFAEEEARRRGISVLDLYTNVVMTEAQALYERAGFTEIERREVNGFHRIFLQRRLDVED